MVSNCSMQGATGFHPQDGDLSAYIEACTAGYRVVQFGIAACGLDVHTPGNYSISFFLSQSLSMPSNPVTRTVVVHPSCPADERLCGASSLA